MNIANNITADASLASSTPTSGIASLLILIGVLGGIVASAVGFSKCLSSNSKKESEYFSSELIFPIIYVGIDLPVHVDDNASIASLPEYCPPYKALDA